MNEKKLTDEQIGILTEFDEYGFAPTIKMPISAEEYAKAWKNSLMDLFERMNFRENEILTELDKELAEHEEFTKKAKEEIERLNAKYCNLENNYNYVYDFYQEIELENPKLKAEIEQLKSDLSTCSNIEKQEKETNAKLRAEIEQLMEEKKSDSMLLYASGLACEQVKAENAELQKQVDELTDKLGKVLLEIDIDENGERPMTSNEKLNYLYNYLLGIYGVEVE